MENGLGLALGLGLGLGNNLAIVIIIGLSNRACTGVTFMCTRVRIRVRSRVIFFGRYCWVRVRIRVRE